MLLVNNNFLLTLAGLTAAVLIVAMLTRRPQSSPDLERMADNLEKLEDYASDTFTLLEQIYETQAAIRGTLDRIDAREAEQAEASAEPWR